MPEFRPLLLYPSQHTEATRRRELMMMVAAGCLFGDVVVIHQPMLHRCA